MKTAWLFPGQGAQKVGMGKALYDTSAAAKAVFDEVDEALGYRLSTLCFEGPTEELMLTANTQPALVATSIAVLRATEEKLGPLALPAFGAGHSLGEYSALIAAGALSLEQGVKLVRLRGEAMQRAVPSGEGGMLAVMGADAEKVETLCNDAREEGILSPANFNCPGQIVIAGQAEAISRAAKLAKERKMKAIPLKVSAPFHCALMAPAALAVAEALKSIQLGPMRFAVVTNVAARPNQEPTQVGEALVQQIAGPVLWQQSVEFLLGEGVRTAFEFGPGKVLAGLCKKTSKELRTLSVGDPASIEQMPDFIG